MGGVRGQPQRPEVLLQPVHQRKKLEAAEEVEGIQRRFDLIFYLGRVAQMVESPLLTQRSWVRIAHRDLSMDIESVLSVTFLRPVMYRPKIGIVKVRKLSARTKYFCFLKPCKIKGIDYLTFVCHADNEAPSACRCQHWSRI